MPARAETSTKPSGYTDAMTADAKTGSSACNNPQTVPMAMPAGAETSAKPSSDAHTVTVSVSVSTDTEASANTRAGADMVIARTNYRTE